MLLVAAVGGVLGMRSEDEERVDAEGAAQCSGRASPGTSRSPRSCSRPIAGVLLRRSPLIVLLSLEIMLNAANLAFVGFSRLFGELDGQIFALAVMAVAAQRCASGSASSSRWHGGTSAGRRPFTELKGW